MLLHDLRRRLLTHAAGQRYLDAFLAACNAGLGESAWDRGPIPRISWRRSAPCTSWNTSSKPCIGPSTDSATWLPPGCATRCRRNGTRAMACGPTKLACRRTPVTARRSPAKSGRTAFNIWNGCLRPIAPQTSVASPPWTRCGGSGFSGITTVRSQGRKHYADAPRTSHRPQRCASTRPATWRPLQQ